MRTKYWNVMVIGAHMRGYPLNDQLIDLGGSLVRDAATAPRYRLFDLGGTPPKPGMIRVGPDESTGGVIRGEIWTLPLTAVGAFVRLIPPPLCIGTIECDDGTVVQGFLCESYAVVGTREITEYGSWREVYPIARR